MLVMHVVHCTFAMLLAHFSVQLACEAAVAHAQNYSSPYVVHDPASELGMQLALVPIDKHCFFAALLDIAYCAKEKHADAALGAAKKVIDRLGTTRVGKPTTSWSTDREKQTAFAYTMVKPRTLSLLSNDGSVAIDMWEPIVSVGYIKSKTDFVSVRVEGYSDARLCALPPNGLSGIKLKQWTANQTQLVNSFRRYLWRVTNTAKTAYTHALGTDCSPVDIPTEKRLECPKPDESP